MSIKTAGDRELVAAVYPFLQEQGFDQTAESFTSAEATFPDTIQVYHAEQQRLQDLAASLTTQFPSLSVTVHHLPNELWQNSWQRETGSFATEKFRVVWDGDPASLPVDDRMTFDLRDATAFGNGQHATTQACLEQLETYPGSRAQRFLDIGAGTGILAMAAHALGYGTIVATDIDEQAVVDSRMFFERYGVTGQVLQGTYPENRTPFDVICCNVLYPELEAITKRVPQYLKPGGLYFTAGLIAKDAPAFLHSCHKVGLRLVRQDECRHWLCLTLTAVK